jgi:hypothetical protein
MSGATPGTTTDIADTLKSGDSSLIVINSLAIDPVTDEAFILGIGGNDQGANIARVPTAGGTYTSVYSAPDTAVNGGNGDVGAIAVVCAGDVHLLARGAGHARPGFRRGRGSGILPRQP